MCLAALGRRCTGGEMMKRERERGSLVETNT